MVDKLNALFNSVVGSSVYSTASAYIEECGMREMICSGTLVGLSGGADSVMLLCFLVEYRRRTSYFPIVAFHLNHSIRGEEADSDEALSHNLCRALSVEFISAKLDIPAMAKSLGIGIEECARNARYSEFSNIISAREELSTVAVAHNSDDNAETVLLNILRGAGTRGAAGIPSVRDNIVRPLLRVAKKDIVASLDGAGISYAIDSTNLSSDYRRNFIRNKVMPLLSEIYDSPIDSFSRFSDNLRSDEECLDDFAKDFLAGKTRVMNKELSSLHRAVFSRVVKKMVGASVSALAVKEIFPLLSKDNFSYTLPGKKSFVCERGVCTVCDNAVREDYSFPVSYGKNEISEYGAAFFLSDGVIDESFLNVYKISIQQDISSAIIVGELYLRPWRAGDSVFYGGMTHKLKKLYNDRKIPNSKKNLIPVLCDERGVVWLPGFGVRKDKDTNASTTKLYAAIGIDSRAEAEVRFYLGNEFKSQKHS